MVRGAANTVGNFLGLESLSVPVSVILSIDCRQDWIGGF